MTAPIVALPSGELGATHNGRRSGDRSTNLFSSKADTNDTWADGGRLMAAPRPARTA
jgi:hypothetical protein